MILYGSSAIADKWRDAFMQYACLEQYLGRTR